MMDYNSLADHLENHDCYLDEESQEEDGVVFINSINDEVSYVRYQESYSPLTVLKICMDLAIDCPLEYEDDYAIFTSFENTRKNNKQ